MKKLFFLFVCFTSSLIFSQIDYSDSWEDFYSYNNVKDFVKVNDLIYALVDNAVFTFNEKTSETNKLSSIQGLSGETTSSIHYNKTFKRLVIGYQNGLIEVIDENGGITISSDIVNFNESGLKSINHITEFGNTLYLSTSFAIVEYNIEKLEFGDTFFIGDSSTSLVVNKTLIFNDLIYAVTEDGIFTANVNSNLLIDFNSWQQEFIGRNFTEIAMFNNKVNVVEADKLYELNNKLLIELKDFNEDVLGLKSTNVNLSVTLSKSVIILNSSYNQIIVFNTTLELDFTANTSFFENNAVYIATQEYGILKSSTSQSSNYNEIHPEGPLSNNVFSIDVNNNNLWVVYGGYDGTYTSIFKKQGFSHFNGEQWINTPFNPSFPVIDLNYVSIDPNAENRVYISSFGDTGSINSVSTGGLLVVEDDEIKTFYNHLNSSLEDLASNQPNRVSLRISGSAFDNQGNLWIANISDLNELKKLSKDGQWSSFDISSLKTNPDKYGLSEVAIDNSNSVWIGTRRNGVYVFNENGDRKKALIASPNLGNLPDTDVKTIAIDKSNRVWLGTRSGMVVYRNASGVFDAGVLNAEPVIIEENGVGERLLGDQNINSIVVDGADNKWFGTDNGGVIYTNPSGRNTLANFSKENSPLPSNRILKIRTDKSNGKVYFATDKGIVAYNSKVATFGEVLGDVYAYPNPALKNHNIITIDGRNGTHLPKGTNVKIVDVAGNLVYETNVVEGQELQGGKVVWNKKNLAGRKVASGVYIVLLTNDDGSESTTTKIAIVN
ncbi:two-component regulator propeller domain-containing protein [Polaribacter ponticola]|uniref:Two-component regulator propeller domain-containing protein n=1 Tax=Polaribacter ponticola TaxID=2978475 RepID=A0ABT5SAY4_9FLAO|nr:two-component regulator propeller domain-containing protein [Polaribacter sp. MSW5]MDD7915268.1 two-component regulator propeller domain-containing protein [Polaribacter sp. MSW5]